MPVANNGSTTAPPPDTTDARRLEALRYALRPLALRILRLLRDGPINSGAIAEAVGANVNTVYSRLRAARKAFNRALSRRVPQKEVRHG